MAADTFLTHSMIAERALFDLENELTMAKHVYRGYNKEFTSAIGGYRKGSSVTIHLPNKYREKDGNTLDTVGVQEKSTTVSIDVHKHVDVDFLETDLTYSIDDFSRRITQPAMITLANGLDLRGCSEYTNIYNEVGTRGTTPSTFQVLADAAERMDNEAVPRAGRVCVTSPRAHWALAAGELKGVFSTQMAETLIRKGFIGNFAAMDFFMDQNCQTHTVGTVAGTPVMNGATAEGATTLAINGWTASTAALLAGDVFTIAGVVGVNPISGTAWENNQLRQFVATADATANASGETTVSIRPSIYSSAAGEDDLPYQTIVTLPANGAAITVLGTASTGYTQNLAFHPDCFALTMVPFKKPQSAGQSVMWAQANDQQLGLSITVASAFDISNYLENTRFDILYGWDTIRSELGVRITG